MLFKKQRRVGAAAGRVRRHHGPARQRRRQAARPGRGARAARRATRRAKAAAPREPDLPGAVPSAAAGEARAAARDPRRRRAAGRRLDLRDQVRRLPADGAHRRRQGARSITRGGHDWTDEDAGAGRGDRGARHRRRAGSTARSSCIERRRRARLQRAAERLRQPHGEADRLLRLRPAVPSTATTCARCRCARAARVLRDDCSRQRRPDRVRFSQSFDADAGADARRRRASMGLEGVIAEARRCALRLRAHRDLAQAQVPAAPGVRDLRLHRPRPNAARRGRQPAARLPRRAAS